MVWYITMHFIYHAHAKKQKASRFEEAFRIKIFYEAFSLYEYRVNNNIIIGNFKINHKRERFYRSLSEN
jgi:hypothetical protein